MHSPDDMDGIEERLAAERPEATPGELDRIKLRAARRDAARRSGPTSMRSRLVTVGVVMGLTIGTGGVIAIAKPCNGNGNNGNGAANSVYCPPSSPNAGAPKATSCGHH